MNLFSSAVTFGKTVIDLTASTRRHNPHPIRGRGGFCSHPQTQLNLLPVDIVFIEHDDSTWQKEMLEKHVVLDDEELKFKIVISGIEETNQIKLEQMGFHHLLLTSTATRPALPTRMALFGPSTQVQIVNGSTEIRVSLKRDDLIQMDVIPEEGEDGDDRERSSLDHASRADSNFSDSEAFLYSGSGWKHKYRGYSLNDDSVSLKNSPFDSDLDLSFIQAGGAELLTVEIEGVSVEGLAMLMNQADYFYYSGHGNSIGNPDVEGTFVPGLDALGIGNSVKPSDLSPYWDRDMDCAIIAGCAVLNINNWVAFPAFFPPTTGPNANYWPGKAMENIGPEFLVGYGASAPNDTQNTASISGSFINSYDSNGNAFSSWRNANDNSNGRNAVAIQRGVKYGYFKRSTFLGIPYYTWTEMAKVGNWVP